MRGATGQASDERLVLGIDSSTTGCKVVAWNQWGEAVAEGRAAHDLHSPEPDAYEQDAEQMWVALVKATREVVGQLGPVRSGAIEALCVAHQRETFVLCDEQGAATAPAIVWMDARCEPDVVAASEALGETFLHERTGKVPCTTPSFYKLLGLFRRRPELRAGRPRLLDVHGFLARRLTGEFVTSLASADPTGLVDLEARAYCEPIVAYAGLTVGQLARLVEPGEVMGGLTREAAEQLGLEAGRPVVAGAGDGQAAGLGAGVRGASAYLNLGTAVVCGRLASSPRIDRGYRTLFGAEPSTFFLEGDLKAGTFLVSWLTGTLLGVPPEGQAARIAALDAEARALPAGADGLVLLPYWSGVMNPYWDDGASGAMVGLRGAHGAGHVFRALLEGLACESRLQLEGLSQGGPIEELVVMGGGARSELFCQVVADVTARRVVRSASAEATSLGAGMLAAMSVGMHTSWAEAVANMTRRGESFEPGVSASWYGEMYERVYRPLYPSLAPAMNALRELRTRAPGPGAGVRRGS